MPLGAKFGGRKKGTPNKDTLKAKELAERLGVDPLEVLLNFVKADWKALGYDRGTRHEATRRGGIMEVPIITEEMRLRAATECAGYIYPKRKAIEMDATVEVDGEVEIVTKEKIIEALQKDVFLSDDTKPVRGAD